MTLVDQNTNSASGGDYADQTGPPPYPLPSDKDIATVKLMEQRWKDGDDELAEARRNYWVNLGFFLGEQWTWWSDQRRQLMSYTANWSPLGNGRARIVRNRIEGNVINVLARMLASPLAFEVPATAADDDVISGAKLAEDVLEAEYHDQQWSTVRYDELFMAIMGGTSAVSVEWDGQAGEQLEVDSASNSVVGTGATRLRAFPITEFCVQPGVSDARRAQWWCCGLTMPPAEARAQYNLDWTPKPDAQTLLSPLQHKILDAMGKPSGQTQCLVLVCYERPNPKMKAGRYCVVINHRVVHETDWPFPFKDRLNLHVFHQEKISGKWAGWTYMNAAIKLQAQYNFYASNLAEIIKKHGQPRLLVPNGFDPDDITDDLDALIQYEATPGVQPPGYLVPPGLPGHIGEHINELKADLDEAMHVSQTSRGQSIGDRASGQALALLSEKDDSPLGLMGTEQAVLFAAIGEDVLALYAHNATETRTISIRGQKSNVPYTRQFTGKMLHGQTRVYIDAEVTKPTSKAASQALAKDLFDRQIIKSPEQYQRIAQLPVSMLVDIANQDVAKAIDENVLMSIGQVEIPANFDDHAIHIAEHNRHRKSKAYRYATPEIKAIMDHHVQAHETMAAEEHGQQVGRAEESPGLAMLPQGAEPAGSMVPPDWAEQQAGLAGDPAAAAAYPQGGGPPQAGSGPGANGLGPPPTFVPPTAELGPGGVSPGTANGVT